MFNPRGTLPPRPRGPNPSGAKPPGAFGARGAPGPPRKAAPQGAPQGAPQRFAGQDAQWTGGSQRINVRVTLHRADPRKVKEKSNLHQEQKGDPRVTRWDGGPCPAGGAAPKAPGPAPVLEQNRNPRSRYTPESASSILASFGLSNEDLEELSRYPDDQLTPENMPRILREIRLRKLGHAAPVPRAPGRGEEAAGEGGGGAVKGKVIDYGHASKYGYTEDPLEIRAYGAEAPPEEPPEARVYNAEAPGAESREEFRRELGAPAAVPPLNPVPCAAAAAAAFPAEDLLKLPAFPGEPSPSPSFFPAEPPAKAPVPCGAAPAKPASRQPPAPPPPALPPMLPALLPAPLPQPLLPPVMPPPVQPPAGQHALPPLTPPPFSAGLLAAISHHEQKQRDAGAAHKGFHKAFRSLAEEPIKSPFGVVKASWLPVFSDPQKCKRLPTPSMMNDYYATSPRIFPHLCSLCNLECALMKDWIVHQNNPAHLESCRRLRLQYPDWNPEAHSSDRNAERKENRTPRRRSGSSSPGRRRSASSRNSASSLRRCRSRSRSPGRFRRPRSRSPRGPRVRSRSPRRRSRSPQRSRRLPRPGAARARRSGSAERPAHRSGRCQGSRVDGAGPGSERPLRAEESEEPGARNPAGVNRLLREEVLSCGTVLHLSELPDAGFSDHDIKRLVQPFGKVSDLIVLRSRNEAYLEMNYKEAVMAAVKFGETEPVLLNGKRIRISVAEGAQAKKPAKKRLVSAKKGPSGTKKLPSAGAKSSKALAGKKEKVKKIPGEKKAKKTSNADGKTAAEDSQPPPEAATEIPESEAPEPQNPPNSEPQNPEIPTNSPNSEPQNPEIPPNSQNSQNPGSSPDPGKAPEAEGSPEFAECSGSGEPPENRDDANDAEESRVLLVSNLPSGGASPQELRGLAEPFGGARDVLVVSSHRRAYLELPASAAEAMLSFYSSSPASVGGNRLQIQAEPRHRSLSDEEAIFATLVEDSDPKAAAPCRRSQLVVLGNLPAEGFRELEVVCAGLRFGKVEHYALLRHRRTALLQLDSPQAARAMHSFLQQYPYAVGGRTLSCSLSARADAPQAEGGTKDVRSEDGSRGSSSSKKTPEAPPKPAGIPSGDAGKSRIPAPDVSEELPDPAAGIPAAPPSEKAAPGAARAEAGIPRDDSELSAPAAESSVENSGAVAAPTSAETPAAETGRNAPKNGDAPAKKRAAESDGTAPKIPENPGGVPGKSTPEDGENAGDATPAGNPPQTPQNKSAPKEPRLGKTFLKAVVSVPDILKRRIPLGIDETAAGKSGERKIPPKNAARPGAGDGQRKGNCGAGGKSSAQPEKESRAESRAASERSRPGESGTSDGNQAPGGSGAAAGKSGAGKQKEEDELFPFNLDEFVTVDEVLEDAEAPATPRRNPPRGKRKEAPRAEPPEPASKRRKGKSCGAGGELSFVTLDEIGEEEEEEEDPRGLVVVDEVAEEEEPSEAAKDPRAPPTLDELSEREEPGSRGRGPRADLEERDLKAEPLVTVDEIGEVEELPLDEPAELSAAAAAADGKSDRGERAASRLPDDPSALVTVDEIQEDNEDNPLVTLDEVNEDEDDFLADFNHLKEELNFVTVDEVGDEEEESALPAKNPPEDEDDEDIVAVAGPEEMGILGDPPAEEEPPETPKPKARPGAEDAEAKAQQKKTAFPGVPKTQSAPKALDILVPKAGFFCQICSLFYADEPSMINHCRTPLHRQNMEKFMAKQQDDDGEEPSSR